MKKHLNSLKEFVSAEHSNFKYRVGNLVASSLSGFIAGVFCATIFWLVAIIFLIKK